MLQSGQISIITPPPPLSYWPTLGSLLKTDQNLEIAYLQTSQNVQWLCLRDEMTPHSPRDKGYYDVCALFTQRIYDWEVFFFSS